MPADLNKPFAESCCDGGACSDATLSAQPCGCDPAANWICEQHRNQYQSLEGIKQQTLPYLQPPVTKYVFIDKVDQHLNEVVSKTWNRIGRCKDTKDEMMNAALGLAGEAGEVADTHKKHFYHTPKDRREEIVLELGDVLYYWNKVRDLWGLSVTEIIEANKKKLFERYGV